MNQRYWVSKRSIDVACRFTVTWLPFGCFEVLKIRTCNVIHFAFTSFDSRKQIAQSASFAINDKKYSIQIAHLSWHADWTDSKPSSINFVNVHADSWIYESPASQINSQLFIVCHAAFLFQFSFGNLCHYHCNLFSEWYAAEFIRIEHEYLRATWVVSTRFGTNESILDTKFTCAIFYNNEYFGRMQIDMIHWKSLRNRVNTIWIDSETNVE